MNAQTLKSKLKVSALKHMQQIRRLTEKIRKAKSCQSKENEEHAEYNGLVCTYKLMSEADETEKDIYILISDNEIEGFFI
jgi:hypothetical protein